MGKLCHCLDSIWLCTDHKVARKTLIELNVGLLKSEIGVEAFVTRMGGAIDELRLKGEEGYLVEWIFELAISVKSLHCAASAHVSLVAKQIPSAAVFSIRGLSTQPKRSLPLL
jgi:hypothetical protein